MRMLGMIAAMFLIVGSVGCVRTIQPILKDEQVVEDASLVGTWVSKDGDQSVEVQAAGADKRYDVVYTDKDNKQAKFVVRLGKIGEMLVAETQPQELAPQASDVYKANVLRLYSFVVVRKANGALLLTTMSMEWLGKYLEAHPKELQTAKVSNDDFVVTSSTADFQAFLLRHAKDEGALGEPAEFVRLEKGAPPK